MGCIKIRKFADKQGTDVSKTEVHSTRELANKYVRIVQYTIVQYNTLKYIKLRYSIEAPNKYLYCTVLSCTVLYKKRKFAQKNTEHRTNVSKTEVHSFLSGSFPDTRGSWPIVKLYSITQSKWSSK